MNWSRCGAFSIMALLVALPRAIGQDSLVVPAVLENAEGSSQDFIAGISARFRQQVLVASNGLQAARAKALVALTFRRDQALGHAYPSWTSDMRITLSHARRFPGNASRRFDENRGLAPIVVFDGQVTLPASPPPPPSIPWTFPWTVRIDFTSTFLYQGGDLCIDMEGEPRNALAGFAWFVDFDQEAQAGLVTAFGAACGVPAAAYVRPLTAWGRNMVPGGTFSIMSYGLAGTPGVLMMAPQPGPTVSLEMLGATGCWLHLVPLLALPALHEGTRGGVTLGPTRTRLHLPGDPAFLGARFAVQSANFEGAAVSNSFGMTTTNGLDITLGTTMPAGAITTIDSDAVDPGVPFPAEGRVGVSRGPVMRIHYQ